MKTRITLSVVAVTIGLTVFAETVKKDNYMPKDGYVPNEETAIAIAVAIWKPLYGKEQIESEKPYNAILSNGVWIVTGTFPKKERTVGGVAVAEISKNDGRIFRAFHGK